MTEEEIEEKIVWAENLKVGDVVCDCRYKHLKIAEMSGEQDYDIQLTLEDGSCCSAIYCCDRADHDWKHPEE